MHSLSTAFVLGYHGCDATIGEKLLQNVRFRQSKNDYDWLGSGIYFWEANPNRALDWARELGETPYAKEQYTVQAFRGGRGD